MSIHDAIRTDLTDELAHYPDDKKILFVPMNTGAVLCKSQINYYQYIMTSGLCGCCSLIFITP